MGPRGLLGVLLLDRPVAPRDVGELLRAEGVVEERVVRLVVIPCGDDAAPQGVEDRLFWSVQARVGPLALVSIVRH